MKDSHTLLEDKFRAYLHEGQDPEALAHLLQATADPLQAEQLRALIRKRLEQTAPEVAEQQVAAIIKRLDAAVMDRTRPARRIRFGYRQVAAAIAFLLVAVAAVFFIRTPEQSQSLVADPILPGTSRATLSFADGSSLDLSESQAGLWSGGDTLKYADGTLLRATGVPQQLTLTTPRAAQYQLTLPDGSRVWLNADSRLSYPSHFEGDERVVELEGEAYFEVRQKTQDNRQQTEKNLGSSVSGLASHVPAEMSPAGGGRGRLPFLVKTAGQTVEVLGTSFNISAYPEDAETKTTLVEGVVQVSAILSPSGGGRGRSIGQHYDTEAGLNTKYYRLPTKLSPGQQAITTDTDINTRQVDVTDYTAWRDGLLVLNNSDLKGIAQQLERWYDVHFEAMPEVIQRKRVFGYLKRDAPLQDVLAALEGLYQLKFEIKGRRVRVVE